MTNDIELPELPQPFYVSKGEFAEVFFWSADQMHAHYAKGREDERKEQIERHANNYQHLLDALAERDALRTELATLKQALAQTAQDQT